VRASAAVLNEIKTTLVIEDVEVLEPGPHEGSVIPIRKDAPLDVVCLVSCGVLGGAGPVFNRPKVPPGASVAVWGCGGVGAEHDPGGAHGAVRLNATQVPAHGTP
jgi:Zn-dependent alcohol dehydrogenase